MQPLILLVDDDTDILVLLKAKLMREAYNGYTSFNGEHLPDNVTALKPDLIMMDSSMKGVDGGSLCQLPKTSNCTQHIPVVLFSGNDNIRHVAAVCKADGIVHKPYDHTIFNNEPHQFIR